ncbi:hypothetical protein VNO77_14119 [Canavalia gladiata]|uniref:Uncharacterized protein n=1 Tax=Canavalia gladiata TaxID=3824 RepID=A0AAN9LYL4_CANGL
MWRCFATSRIGERLGFIPQVRTFVFDSYERFQRVYYDEHGPDPETRMFQPPLPTNEAIREAPEYNILFCRYLRGGAFQSASPQPAKSSSSPQDLCSLYLYGEKIEVSVVKECLSTYVPIRGSAITAYDSMESSVSTNGKNESGHPHKKEIRIMQQVPPEHTELGLWLLKRLLFCFLSRVVAHLSNNHIFLPSPCLAGSSRARTESKLHATNPRLSWQLKTESFEIKQILTCEASMEIGIVLESHEPGLLLDLL